MKSNNKPRFYFRDVLLSTGEYTKEAVINFSGMEVYESVPRGITIGMNEINALVSEDMGDYASLENPNVFELSQNLFDNNIASRFKSQTGTALSMVFLKYLALRNNFKYPDLYKFIAKTYGRKISFPKPIFNILNGGKHAGNGLDFCEFMIIPNESSIKDCIRIASEVYLDLRDLIENKFGNKCILVGREGGFSPNISDIELALELIRQSIKARNDGNCSIAIDIAANNFGRLIESGKNNFEYFINGNRFTTESLVKYYQNVIIKFPEIKYLEDPFHENDINGWQKLNLLLKNKILIVADDLTITNVSFLEKYNDCFNACTLKVNQAGSVTGLEKAYNFCVDHGVKTIISQRSGETDSDIIAHLAAGLGSDYIKAGAPARERIIKYNSLIRMEDMANDRN